MDPSHTLDYIVLAALDGNGLSAMTLVRHGDMLDTSEKKYQKGIAEDILRMRRS